MPSVIGSLVVALGRTYAVRFTKETLAIQSSNMSNMLSSCSSKEMPPYKAVSISRKNGIVEYAENLLPHFTIP